MTARPNGFLLAVAALAREATRIAQEEDADVRLSPRAMEAAMRAAEGLAAVARAGAAPPEADDAAAVAVEAVAAELALARGPGPRRLAVVLEVEVASPAHS